MAKLAKWFSCVLRSVRCILLYVLVIIICPVWPNGWVFVYGLIGSGFESSCSQLIFEFRSCFEKGVPWHSGNYRVWIHSEPRTWHDKNVQSDKVISLKITEAATVGVLWKKVFKFTNLTGKHLLTCNFQKDTPAQVFSCEY